MAMAAVNQSELRKRVSMKNLLSLSGPLCNMINFLLPRVDAVALCFAALNENLLGLVATEPAGLIHTHTHTYW